MPNTNDLKLAPLRCLLYGRTGIGKTTLLGTAPKPFIIATEDGLEPLSSSNIDYQRITTTVELKHLWKDIQKAEYAKYDTICIDSLTALSDLILSEVEKETGAEEAMTTYPLVRTRLLKLVNGYLKLPKHVIMTATETRGDNKPVLPSVIGGKLCEDLARLFDHVQFMDFGSKEDSVIIHRSRHRYSVAKDRTGQLGNTPAKYTKGYFDDVILTITGSLPTKDEPTPPTPPAPANGGADKEGGSPSSDGGTEKDGGEIPFEFDL